MAKADHSYCIYGIIIVPHCGYVEATWKVPVKYQRLAKAHIDTHYDHAIQPALKYVYKDDDMIISIQQQIDYSELFNGVKGSNLYKYNQIIENRDDAINDACFYLAKMVKSFKDMIRGQFYTARFIDNAPSIP
jgi:hypothetical protein